MITSWEDGHGRYVLNAHVASVGNHVYVEVYVDSLTFPTNEDIEYCPATASNKREIKFAKRTCARRGKCDIPEPEYSDHPLCESAEDARDNVINAANAAIEQAEYVAGGWIIDAIDLTLAEAHTLGVSIKGIDCTISLPTFASSYYRNEGGMMEVFTRVNTRRILHDFDSIAMVLPPHIDRKEIEILIKAAKAGVSRRDQLYAQQGE